MHQLGNCSWNYLAIAVCIMSNSPQKTKSRLSTYCNRWGWVLQNPSACRLCYLFQHGLGTENEAVLMTHHTQVLLESHACNLTGRYWRQTSEMALISFPGLIFWIKFTVFIQIYRIVSSRHRRTLKLLFTIVEISRHSFNLRMEFTNLAFRWFRLYAIFSEECLDGVQTKSKHSGCV